eukprot:749858-Hanusia_phi.AAC.6
MRRTGSERRGKWEEGVRGVGYSPGSFTAHRQLGTGGAGAASPLLRITLPQNLTHQPRATGLELPAGRWRAGNSERRHLHACMSHVRLQPSQLPRHLLTICGNIPAATTRYEPEGAEGEEEQTPRKEGGRSGHRGRKEEGADIEEGRRKERGTRRTRGDEADTYPDHVLVRGDVDVRLVLLAIVVHGREKYIPLRLQGLVNASSPSIPLPCSARLSAPLPSSPSLCTPSHFASPLT